MKKIPQEEEEEMKPLEEKVIKHLRTGQLRLELGGA